MLLQIIVWSDGCISAKAKPIAPNTGTILELKKCFLYREKAVFLYFNVEIISLLVNINLSY